MVTMVTMDIIMVVTRVTMDIIMVVTKPHAPQPSRTASKAAPPHLLAFSLCEISLSCLVTSLSPT